MKMMASHFTEALPVKVTGNSPQQPMRGTPMVDIGKNPTGSSTYPLDILAALSKDRKTFILSIVNPTQQAHSFTSKISGVTLRGNGKLSQIAAPDAHSNNEPGKEPGVSINERPQTTLPQVVEVPPISVNVYRFEIA